MIFIPLNNSVSFNDFDAHWEKWMTNNGLKGNQWLSDMFSIRHSWCPAYMTNYFFFRDIDDIEKRGNEQYCENEDQVLLHIIGVPWNFESVLKSIREKENQLEYEDRFGNPSLCTILGIERGVVGFYTSQIFFEFREQVVQSLNYVCYLEFDNNGDASPYAEI